MPKPYTQPIDTQGRRLPAMGIGDLTEGEELSLTILANYQEAEKCPDLAARLDAWDLIYTAAHAFASGQTERAENIINNPWTKKEARAIDALVWLWNKRTKKNRKRQQGKKRQQEIEAKATKESTTVSQPTEGEQIRDLVDSLPAAMQGGAVAGIHAMADAFRRGEPSESAAAAFHDAYNANPAVVEAGLQRTPEEVQAALAKVCVQPQGTEEEVPQHRRNAKHPKVNL